MASNSTLAGTGLKLGILASHPIQYQAPLFRELAKRCELLVYYVQRQTPQAQGAAGFGVGFEWDVDLLSGYTYQFLDNVSAKPDTGTFFGCDTPGIAKEIQTGAFDAFLVMGWHLKSFWQAVRQCRRQGVPVMVRGDSQLASPRSRVKRAVKAVLYPWVIRQFDACLYVGQRNRAYLEHYGAQEHRLFFSPHCVDTEAFAAAAAKADRGAVRAGWRLSEHDQAVLFAGKLVARKRPADLVQAVAQLRSEGRSVVIVWAGDGPERNALDFLAKSLHVPTVFLGFCNQTELPAIYRSADVLALPSDGSETWGLVVNEAMACGTPCVVSDACGCAPDMIPGKAGSGIFPLGDVAAFARALATVLAAPPAQAAIKGVSEAHSLSAAAAGIMECAVKLTGRILQVRA
ncbi:MAG: glycosyltransferase family 4 protein [Ramlibacter sp.]|nr:glycosyltransferase family 4 protein [Ramlibacter sp.]